MGDNKTSSPATDDLDGKTLADKSTHIGASGSKEQSSESFSKVSRRVIHVYDDTERNPGKFDWVEKIWIPTALGVIGLVATVMGSILGFGLSSLQEDNAKADRLIERASAASTSRQAVLTNYASRITDLIAEKGAMEFDSSNPEKIAIWNAMRGETIIALKRLDDTRDDGRGEIDVLKDTMREDILGIEANTETQGENRQLADLDGFDDSGKLKGELVRFLYEARLLTRANANDDRDGLLRGADLVRVVLNDAPMPNANLRRAWISGGQFQKANLNGSNLQGAELDNANFEGAILERVDLSWTNLKNANLSSVNLTNADLRSADLTDIIVTSATTFTGACYDTSTSGLESLDVESLGLIDASNEPTDNKCSDIK
ncbi:MAG: pentapeptide repeat-containing protein [Leptolyngbyaceae cyanobacterium]|mgnify:CR=1 FL=1